jgi:hypothetical protein
VTNGCYLKPNQNGAQHLFFSQKGEGKKKTSKKNVE